MPVPPGSTSQPFADFREILAAMSPDQQTRAVGSTAYKLIQAGVVPWDAVVTRSRVRPIHEVVAQQKLTIAQMTAAGVPKGIAKRTYNLAFNPQVKAADAEGRQIVQKLTDKGLSRERIKEGLGERIAGRVSVKGGRPRGGSGPAPPPLPPPPPPSPSPPLKPPKPSRPKVPPKPKPPKPVVPLAGTPILPGRPIGERIAAYKEGDRKVERVLKLDAERSKAESKLVAERAKVHKQFDKLMERQIRLMDAAMKRQANGPPGSPAFPPEVVAAVDAMQVTIDAVKARSQEIEAALRASADATRARVVDSLAAAQPAKLAYLDTIARNDITNHIYEPNPETRASYDKAREFVGKLMQRGDSSDFEVQIAEINFIREQRAHYSTTHGYVALSKGDSATVAVHELGHAIDDNLRTSRTKVLDRSLEFLAHRVGSEPPQKLKDLFPASNYGDHERGRKDKFDEVFSGSSAYYVGKDYGSTGTEILSMGLQKLYEDPIGFAQKDPEYFKFVVGIMDGSLR